MICKITTAKLTLKSWKGYAAICSTLVGTEILCHKAHGALLGIKLLTWNNTYY